MIDSIINYWLGISYWDDYRYKLVKEDQRFQQQRKEKKQMGEELSVGEAETESKTSDIKIYHIPHKYIRRHL